MCTRSAAQISNNPIATNTAKWLGGGIQCYGKPSPTISGNTITGNQSGYNGGGIDSWESAPSISNNTIASNTAPGGAGIGTAASPKASLKNCILWANTAPSGAQLADSGIAALTVSYSDLQGGRNAVFLSPSNLAITYVSNIDADPLFADLANRDFHVKSKYGRWDPAPNAGAGEWVLDDPDSISPCIDAGSPADAFANEPHPNGSRINIGACGNTAQASKSPWLPADATGDCIVNILDLIAIRNLLGQDPSTGSNWRADVNNDGKVNILDLIVVRGKLGTKL